MKTSCLRCGNCCTRFGVCVTFFDILRIQKATGKNPEEFLELIADYPEREREEPAIMIDGRPCLLVLKMEKGNLCGFYSASGCRIYENRPLLCRAYPFVLKKEKLFELKSRCCPKSWKPSKEEEQQYKKDAAQYKKEVEEYKKIAEKWNKKGGSFREFLSFINSYSAV
jgi:hypothetical protein